MKPLTELLKIAEAATRGPWIAMPTPQPSYCDPGYRAIYKPWREPNGVFALAANMRVEGRGFVWGEDAAHIAAFDPPTAQALVKVAMAAEVCMRLRDERIHTALTERSAATRTEELIKNGEAMEDAAAALRAALKDFNGKE
jgi:hypothetical protein